MYVCDNHFLKAANRLEATFIFKKKLYVNVGSNLRMYLYNVCWTECLWVSWEQQYKFFSYKMLLKIFAKYSSCLSKPCFLYCVVNRDQSLLLGTGTGQAQLVHIKHRYTQQTDYRVVLTVYREIEDAKRNVEH